jgi:hypothetical protein
VRPFALAQEEINLMALSGEGFSKVEHDSCDTPSRQRGNKNGEMFFYCWRGVVDRNVFLFEDWARAN